MEGIASRHGPESCTGGGNVAGEASAGVRTGQPLSSEITPPGCRPRCNVGKATRAVAVPASGGPAPRSRRPCACAEALCARTGRPQWLPVGRWPWGRSGKARGRNPDTDAAGESDIGVVPANVPNKAGSGEVGGHGGTVHPPRNRKGRDGNPPPTLDGAAGPARRSFHNRAREERPMTEGNSGQPPVDRTLSRGHASSGLDRARAAARKDPSLRFTALLHHVTPSNRRPYRERTCQAANSPQLDRHSHRRYNPPRPCFLIPQQTG
jgi:hypothetical protein